MLNKYVKPLAIAAVALSAVASANAQSVKGTITLPGLPEQLAVNPLSNRIYVAVPNFGAEPFDYLTVVDGKDDKVIRNIEIPPVAYAVAVDPFNCLVYVGGTFTDSEGVNRSEVVAVDDRTNRVIKTITVSTTAGDGIQGLAVDLLSGDLYVTNASDNEVDVIHRFEVSKRIPTDGEPYGVAFNPYVNNLYVSLLNGNVSIISGRTKTITATTSIGTIDAGIAVNIVTGNVFVSDSVSIPGSGSVGVLGHSGSVLGTIPVGHAPLGIDVDFGTDLVFVANSQDNTVSVINGKTNTVSATLPVSSLFLAVNPFTQKVYVAPSANTPLLTVIKEK